jgi:hypothetical protein
MVSGVSTHSLVSLTPDTVSPRLNHNLGVRLQISMRHKGSSGESFTSAAHWVRDQGIRRLELQVSDTLYRHNLGWKDDVDPEEAAVRARALGDVWLEDNRPTIYWCQAHFDELRLTRWDYWRTHQHFATSMKLVTSLVHRDPSFERAINLDVHLYFDRLGRSLNADRAASAREFLLEEIAVSNLSARWEPANEVYVGQQIQSADYVIRKKIRKFSMLKVPFLFLVPAGGGDR